MGVGYPAQIALHNYSFYGGNSGLKSLLDQLQTLIASKSMNILIAVLLLANRSARLDHHTGHKELILFLNEDAVHSSTQGEWEVKKTDVLNLREPKN